jgi:hypothetical protein
VPTCAWPWLLNETARNDWGFDGYITGDCGAARDVCSKCQDCSCPGGHHFTSTPAETVRDVLTAGLDNDCGNMVSPNNTMLCEKRLFLRLFLLRLIVLPRQAQDKHRKSRDKRALFAGL